MDAFTLAELDSYGDVRAAVLRGARVRWLESDGETVREGTLRHFCVDMSGVFPAADCDVRDMLLRITLRTGMERFVTVPEFADWYRLGYVAFEN